MEDTKGTAFTPKGTMPKDKLLRFGLVGNSPFPVDYKAYRADRTVQRLCKIIGTYRQCVQGNNEPRLPKALVYIAHYFAIPMTKADSDNPKDRRGIDRSAEAAPEVVESNILATEPKVA
jgi:hypothetical protein